MTRTPLECCSPQTDAALAVRPVVSLLPESSGQTVLFYSAPEPRIAQRSQLSPLVVAHALRQTVRPADLHHPRDPGKSGTASEDSLFPEILLDRSCTYQLWHHEESVNQYLVKDVKCAPT